MKMPKLFRPELEIEFIGIKGFFVALAAILKVGIKRAHIDLQIRKLFNGNGGTVKRCYFWVVPKYKFKRVTKIIDKE